MERHTPRITGSLWGKGTIGMVCGAVILTVLLVWVPAIRWFLAISVVIGLIMAGAIHWWNEHKPLKDAPEAEIRLHLLDDDDERK